MSTTNSPTATRHADAIARLREAGQDHVLRFWDELDDDARERLLDQVEAIDLDLLASLRRAQSENASGEERGPRTPARVLALEDTPEFASRERARERGEELIRAGKVAILLVAGGQGSRLGFAGPKGCLPVGPLSDRTLFELHAGKIARLREKLSASIPWYIMTSQQNDADTRAFFDEHDFFGLPREEVRFLPQSMLPALDEDGRLILAAKDRVFESPGGHGGCYAAMRDGGALDDAISRGIEHLLYFQVDNPLVQLPDPLFVGLHDLAGSEMSFKVLAKTGPDEKMGVVALEGGKPVVVEYSDLSDDEAHRRDASGKLVYWAGSIGIHLFRLDFVRRVASGEVRLPWHLARKEIPAVDAAGAETKVRGTKFEAFVFDALPMAASYLHVEVVREQEFAPIKNPAGVDSLESGRELLIAEHRRWLTEAGIEASGRVEVSPFAAVDARDLAASLAARRGERIDGDVRVERTAAGSVDIV